MKTLSKEVLFKLRCKEWKRWQLHTGRIGLHLCVFPNNSQCLKKKKKRGGAQTQRTKWRGEKINTDLLKGNFSPLLKGVRRGLVQMLLLLLLKDLLFIYLWLGWVFVAASRVFSSCGEWGLLLVAVLGLLVAETSCGWTWAPELGPSSCGAQAWFFPNQGSNPCPLHWQADS